VADIVIARLMTPRRPEFGFTPEFHLPDSGLLAPGLDVRW